MATLQTQQKEGTRPSLDEQLYALDEAEFEFFSSQTGIKDGEELKKHIVKVQTEAYAVSIDSQSCSIDLRLTSHLSLRFIHIVAFADSHSPSMKYSKMI